VKWRLEYKADQIDAESIRELLLRETIVVHKHDKLGKVCLVVRPRFHVPGDFTIEQLVRYGIFIIEHATEEV